MKKRKGLVGIFMEVWRTTGIVLLILRWTNLISWKWGLALLPIILYFGILIFSLTVFGIFAFVEKTKGGLICLI